MPTIVRVVVEGEWKYAEDILGYVVGSVEVRNGVVLIILQKPDNHNTTVFSREPQEL